MDQEKEKEQVGQDDQEKGRQEDNHPDPNEEEGGGDGAGSRQQQQEPEGWEDIEIPADHDWSQGPPEGIRNRIKELTGRTRDLEQKAALDDQDRDELLKLRGQLEVYEKTNKL